MESENVGSELGCHVLDVFEGEQWPKRIFASSFRWIASEGEWEHPLGRGSPGSDQEGIPKFVALGI